VENGTTPRTLPASVRGMRINEITLEPGRFTPSRQAVDIMQLPPASSLQYTNNVATDQAVGSSLARASSNTQDSNRSASAGGTGWQSRN
jgi:hypothetical protein